MLLDFRYEMALDFSDPVEDQYFSLQCIPRNTDRQKLIEINTEVEPYTDIRMDTDGIGNHKLYGLIKPEHSAFRLRVSGKVETMGSLYEEYQDPSDVELYRYIVSSKYTQPGPELETLYHEWAKTAPEDAYGRLIHFGNCVKSILTYTSGSTDVSTTAEEALRLRKGVCQDFAHLLIALLRMDGMPARYVVGLIQGEGESHAWVEANCKGYWYGIDPTNNLLVNDIYIKFAHGRDYEDCMVSRGIFRNPRAIQTMGVSVTVSPQQ